MNSAPKYPQVVRRAAALLGCRPQDLLGWRLLPGGGVTVIAPRGAKYRFDAAGLNLPGSGVRRGRRLERREK